MSWVDKARKREQIRKNTELLLKSPEYKKHERELFEQATMNAFVRFTFICCLFLETRHGYKKNGLINFIKYVGEYLTEINEKGDSTFYEDCRDYYLKTYDLDICKLLGVKWEENDET